VKRTWVQRLCTLLKRVFVCALSALAVRVGNEGYGVRPIVKRLCTGLVQIEMVPGDAAAAAAGGDTGMGQRQRRQLVDSLNVSVATGILLHHMLSSARQ
jgi:21S rRNA (GM2251-2'-O)-methyltransferase